MIQEEKTLLLKDLCGRLLYGIMLNVTLINKYEEVVNRDLELTEHNFTYITSYSHWKEYKPYLRPLSSMTDEERKEFRLLGGVISYNPNHNTYSISAFSPEAYDWLNKKMFDYRGLIEKGLAIEAPEVMYNN